MSLMKNASDSRITLVPEAFFVPEKARELLSEVASLGAEDEVKWLPLPAQGAVLVYSPSPDSPDEKPELFRLIESLKDNPQYNKVHASWKGGYLNLVLAQGKNLLLANVFQAPDFTTAQYFLFLAMKEFQLNPEVTTVYVGSPLQEEDEMSLYRYFKAVESI